MSKRRQSLSSCVWSGARFSVAAKFKAALPMSRTARVMLILEGGLDSETGAKRVRNFPRHSEPSIARSTGKVGGMRWA